MKEEIHNKHKGEMDMLNGPLAGKLILFALPLAFSSLLQQLFNSADVAIVGRFAGDDALSAVGSCVALVGIFVNLMVGLSVGPNAALANLIGQDKRDKIHDMLHTIIMFSILLGLALMVIGFLSARTILSVSGTPEAILDQALIYVRIYIAGIPFIMIYNYGAAVLRSFGDTKIPLACLLFTGCVNVALNIVFVVFAQMGVAGVALATTIANILSAMIILAWLHHKKGDFQLRFRDFKIYSGYLSKILAIGIPAGLQGALFSVSNAFIQGGINSFMENAIAGSSVALNFEYFSFDISSAFAQAAITFISQNFGAGNIKRCKKIFWQCLVFGIGFTELLSAVFIIWDDFFIGIYTASAGVTAFAMTRLHYVCALEGMTATYEVSSSALRGIGRPVEPAVFVILGTVVFRLIWLSTVFQWNHTFETLMSVYVASWIFTGTTMLITYFIRMHQTAKKFSKA